MDCSSYSVYEEGVLLQASLMAGNTRSWSEDLPIVLLGLRSAYKEDTKCTPAEMVYGQCLNLPGELLGDNTEDITPETFVERLRDKIRNFRPAESRMVNNKTYLHSDLQTAEYVFVRVD